MRVKVKKIKGVNNPLAPTPKMDEYAIGKINDMVSLPVEYEIEGECDSLPVIGQPFYVARDKRNGVEALGFFNTTEVVQFVFNDKHQSGNFETRNSVYQIDVLTV